MTNSYNADIAVSLISSSMRRRVSNASVTSGNTHYEFQALFLPLPLNAETVSHSVNVWKTGRAIHVLGSVSVTISRWVSIESLMQYQMPTTVLLG